MPSSSPTGNPDEPPAPPGIGFVGAGIRPPFPVRGAILAGGSATRLQGIPKGLEIVGGRRILDRVIDALRSALGHDPVLIANDPGAGNWSPGLAVIADREPGAGPLGGIATALEAAAGPVLCVAWDMPFLEAGLLREIAGRLTDADASIPESEGPRGLEPLAAAYAPSALPPIRLALAAGRRSAVSFHPGVRLARVPLAVVRSFGDPARLFFNVNTAADLARARRWAASPSPDPAG